jgi:hypothetical protein
MDCEDFDQHVIDALYAELDELTHAAFERHVEGCARCAPVYAGLRATRAVAVLPLEEPPADLEARILEATALAGPFPVGPPVANPHPGLLRSPYPPAQAVEAHDPPGAIEPEPSKIPQPPAEAIVLQSRVPWHRRVLRRAMGPQLAIAATFFLVVGASLFVFRSSPSSLDKAAAPAAEAVVATAAPKEAPAATAEAPPPPAYALPAEPSPAGGEASAVAQATASASAVVARGAANAAGAPAHGARARPAAKPAPASVGGPDPRAPAAPRKNVGFSK